MAGFLDNAARRRDRSLVPPSPLDLLRSNLNPDSGRKDGGRSPVSSSVYSPSPASPSVYSPSPTLQSCEKSNSRVKEFPSSKMKHEYFQRAARYFGVASNPFTEDSQHEELALTGLPWSVAGLGNVPAVRVPESHDSASAQSSIADTCEHSTASSITSASSWSEFSTVYYCVRCDKQYDTLADDQEQNITCPACGFIGLVVLGK